MHRFAASKIYLAVCAVIHHWQALSLRVGVHRPKELKKFKIGLVRQKTGADHPLFHREQAFGLFGELREIIINQGKGEAGGIDKIKQHPYRTGQTVGKDAGDPELTASFPNPLIDLDRESLLLKKLAQLFQPLF